MFVFKAIDVMIKGLQSEAGVNALLNTDRPYFIDCLSAAKAMVLDREAALFCNSLVRDLDAESGMLDHLSLPYPVTWVEFDRLALAELTDVKGLEGVKPDRLEAMKTGSDKWDIAYLYDNTNEDALQISAFRDRGRAIVEPMVVFEIPKDNHGSFNFARRQVTLTALGELIEGASGGEDIRSDVNSILGFWHIPLALFTLMIADNENFSISDVKAPIKAKRTKSLAKKVLRKRVFDVPKIDIVKLSEIGALHNEAVAAEMSNQTAPTTGKRASPRRHPVRGCLVRLEDKVTWRRPHFRGGGPSLPSVTKVVGDKLPDGSSV